jgi:hypothetical protein
MDIQQLYLGPVGRSYREDFRTFVNQWKSGGRKATSEDLDFLFSYAKDSQTSLSSSRASSIKRSATAAKALRLSISDLASRAEKDRERTEQDGKVPVGEIFDEIFSALVPALIKEQSFIMEFLHLSPSW